MKAKFARRRKIELPEGRACFAVFELVRLLSIRRERIMDLIEEGDLRGAIDMRGKGASRACIRVPRQCVLEALADGSVHHTKEKKTQARIINRRVAAILRATRQSTR